MSTFTITLHEIIDNGVEIWDHDRPFPIFDEAYRRDLEEKIEDHYALREIGTETIGHFRFMLNRKMREIMPYYNQLYRSEKLVAPEDALLTTKITTAAETEGSSSDTTHSTNSNTTSTENSSRAVTSDTPQTRLAGNEDYATGATDVDGETSVTGSGTGDATQTGQTSGNMTNTVTGSQGHTAVLLAQYRASFLNIDMMVVEALEPLFMSVWDNGDEFFHNNRNGGFYGYRSFGGYPAF